MFTYVALPDEVDTRELITKALALKKSVYVPHLGKSRDRITIYRISNLARDLRRGTFGIRQPKPSPGAKGRVSEMDLMIIPGLGFDHGKGRLGRGLGCFDRLLKDAKDVKKVGLAFREQIVKRVPMTRRDVRVDRVIRG